MNFIVYRLNEPPSLELYESNYDSPISGLDNVLLLWKNDQAVGFATVRLVYLYIRHNA